MNKRYCCRLLLLLFLLLLPCCRDEERSIFSFGLERAGSVEAAGAVTLSDAAANFSTNGSRYVNGLLISAFSITGGTLVVDLNMEGLDEGDSVPLVREGTVNDGQVEVSLFDAKGGKLGEIDPLASADSSVEIARIALEAANAGEIYLEIRGEVTLQDTETSETFQESFTCTLEAEQQ